MGLVIDRTAVSTLAKKIKASQSDKKLSHQQVLEVIAHGFGFANYGALHHFLSSDLGRNNGCSSSRIDEVKPNLREGDALPKITPDHIAQAKILATDIVRDRDGLRDNFWNEKARGLLYLLISFFLAGSGADHGVSVPDTSNNRDAFLTAFVDWYVETRLNAAVATEDPVKEFIRFLVVEARMSNEAARRQGSNGSFPQWLINDLQLLLNTHDKTFNSYITTMDAGLLSQVPHHAKMPVLASTLHKRLFDNDSKTQFRSRSETLLPFQVRIVSSEKFSAIERYHFIAEKRAEKYFKSRDLRDSLEIVRVSPASNYDWAFSKIRSGKVRSVDPDETDGCSVSSKADDSSNDEKEYHLVFEYDVLMWSASAQEAHETAIDFVRSQLTMDATHKQCPAK